MTVDYFPDDGDHIAEDEDEEEDLEGKAVYDISHVHAAFLTPRQLRLLIVRIENRGTWDHERK